MLMIVVVLSCTVAGSADSLVPINIQFPILLKVLSFERNLSDRVGDEIVIAVLFQSRFRPSLLVRREWQDAAAESGLGLIAEIPFRTIYIDLSTESDVGALVLESEVDVLFVAPVRAFNLTTIISLSRKHKILTMAASPEYVHSGLAIAVESIASRPRIVVNRKAAIAEGVNLSSQVLKLSRLIDADGAE